MKKPVICSVFLLLIIFILNPPSPTLSADSYTAVDNIVVDCGSTSSGTTNADDRRWESDNPSKFLQPGSDSASSPPRDHSTSLESVPYLSARISRSNFTYSFPVTPGQKFIRLYFFPAAYAHDFDKSTASFSVTAAAGGGQFTLLDNFIPDLNLAPGRDGIQLEFCLNVNPNQPLLNLTFTATPGKYAFVNGIEIVSMPTNLYYSAADATGIIIVGNGNQLGHVENDTALQLMYRLNVGSNDISPDEGTGMYRRWIPDTDYFVDSPSSLYNNNSIQLQYRYEKNKLAAPATVYRTARGMSNDSQLNLQYNLTWRFPVDPSFTYFVRLHFCEIQPPVNMLDNRAFWIYIANRSTPGYLDVIQEAGGNGFPMFKDFLVRIAPENENENEKKQLFLFVALHPFNEGSAFFNSILNGAEIFKLSRSGSLAGPNPDRVSAPSSPGPPSSSSNSSPAKLILIVAGGVVLGLAVLSLLLFFVFRRRRGAKSESAGKYVDGGDGSDFKPILPYSSFSSTNQTSKGSSNLPSDLCRRFSLSEIESATGGFDDHFIIGVGGFGDVYKGLINVTGGGATTVAIKRLKQGSQQGANEFRTEIEMLSQLRHLHLVSLIGYCYDGGEMILVYDYMSRGTLRDHLYNKSDRSSAPIPWQQRLEICIGAANGLHYLHSGAKHTIIHRDVKTTNILLDEKWVAKVSDFGLSKVGPVAGAPNAHVSTVVKGSFGYLDPEYYRLQRLTEKSDVYSFGIVLWEVLTALPPVNRSGSNNKKLVSLAELARQCCKNGRVTDIVDRDLDGEIAPECLKRFAKVAMSCLVENGVDRPSMADVVWGLEFARELQRDSDERVKLLAGGGGGDGVAGAEMNGYSSSVKSSGDSGMFTTNSEIALGPGIGGMMMMDTTATGGSTGAGESSTSQDMSEDSLLGSRGVFSEILDPKAR